MTERDRRALRAIIPALDDDLAEMSEGEVQRELATSGVDLKAATTAFKAFASTALAAARRRELTTAEEALASRSAPRDLFQKAVQLTLDFTDEMIRALIVEKGGLVPAHRERDGNNERELLIQTLADVMALKGEE